MEIIFKKLGAITRFLFLSWQYQEQFEGIIGNLMNRGWQMHINDLTKAMDEFVKAKGWYKPDTLRAQTPRNIAISLCLESAEVLEHFQWTEQIENRESLASELADVTLYLLQLAQITNINLEEAVLKKLNQNYQREWDQNKKREEK